jgi:hypothetical protein
MPATIYRSSIATCGASERTRELACFFGVPCVLRSVWGTSSGFEHRRMQPEDIPVGCLNQPWVGPAVVWYPEGDWVSPTTSPFTGETNDTRRD